jgi:hypothetical protein
LLGILLLKGLLVHHFCLCHSLVLDFDDFSELQTDKGMKKLRKKERKKEKNLFHIVLLCCGILFNLLE